MYRYIPSDFHRFTDGGFLRNIHFLKNYNVNKATHKPKQPYYRRTKQWLGELDRSQNLIQKQLRSPDLALRNLMRAKRATNRNNVAIQQ